MSGLHAGSWTLHRRLGGGANGDVYEATNNLGQRAAIKVLKPDLHDGADAAARMLREAGVGRTVRHPGIVPVEETGTLDDGRPYLVMPLVDSPSLRAWMEEHTNRMTPQDAWRVLRLSAQALQSAHSAGVIHRDVKPENMLLNGAQQALLTDFGLARIDDAQARLTRTGVTVGTPLYMPPEQWWGNTPVPASDQYALAAVFHELIEGHPPFDAESLPALMQAHLSAPVPTIAHPTLAPVLARALSKAPADRFPSMDAFIHAVDQALDVRPRTSPAAVLVALCAAAAVFVVGYAGIHNPLELSRLAGWSAYAIAAAFILGMVTLILGKPSTGWAVTTGVMGTLGTLTGWHTVLRHADTVDLANKFPLFQAGMFEANINRVVGMSLTGALLLGLLCLPVPVFSRRTSSAGIAAMVFALVGAAALLIGAVDVAWITLASAGACGLDDADPRRGARLRLGVVRTVLVMLMGGAAHARVDATLAAAWMEGAERAERARIITQVYADRSVVELVWFISVVTTLVIAALQVRRATGPVPTKLRVLMASAVVWMVVDVSVLGWVAWHHRAAWQQLAPVFSSFLQLQPPVREGLPTPAVAPCLRLARDVVALDSERVGLTASLASPEGTAALAQDLAHRLAAADAPLSGPTHLLLMMDGQVPWHLAARALGVAWGLGVREVQVLFTRGAPLQLSATAPPEAAYAIARDFGALRVTLTLDDTPAIPPDATVAQATLLLPDANARVRVLR